MTHTLTIEPIVRTSASNALGACCVRGNHVPYPAHSVVRPLPDHRELVEAFGGHRADSATDLPLVCSPVHWQSGSGTTIPVGAAGIDCRRAELVAAINAWMIDQLLATPALHRTSPRRILGATVDRIAAAHVHASNLLHTAEKVSDDRVHAARYSPGPADRASPVTFRWFRC